MLDNIGHAVPDGWCYFSVDKPTIYGELLAHEADDADICPKSLAIQASDGFEVNNVEKVSDCML